MEKELLWRAAGRGSKKQSLQHATVTVDTLDKIRERMNKKAVINTSRTRAEKAKAQGEYTELNKLVKRSIRTDKRKYVEDLAMTAEKAAREGNMRQLYDTTKKLSGNYRKLERQNH
ncbi:unnamed protein product [Schistosoma margrebowiei]|uniref:Uncharacterized protein n=1 Tax=Schistosoma margrebowiei TaxID=48269 RepID=A0A183MV25_9TREM|nr:unnamed protein product [Schistosoma margrebowiei]